MDKKPQTINFSLFNSGLIFYGLVLTVSQVILMRELVAIFYGNELSMGILLAVWLFWSAIGSGVLGKFLAPRVPPVTGFAVLQLLLALVFPLTLYFSRMGPRLFHLPVGEISGLFPIIFIPLLTLSIFCLAAGALFTLGCRIFAFIQPQEKTPVGKVYIFEAVGAAIGGALASFFLIKYFSAFQIAAFLGALHFAFGVAFLLNRHFRRLWGGLLLILLIFIATFPGWLSVSRFLEKNALQRYWANANVLKNENSVYGTLTVTALENAHSFYQNGLLMFTVPDLYTSEEAVHLALLQHEAPENVLLIGGGIAGCLQQILLHPGLQHVDYVELDPNLVKLAREVLPKNEIQVLNDPRVQFHFMDGRLFLKKCHRKYDVIITNLPDPSSTQINRFFTLEFFREVKQQLHPAGVFGFQISSAENYITENLARYIHCIYYTLRQAFENVVIIPGITNYLVASPANVLTDQPALLISRLHRRHLQTEFVNEYYLPFRMSPERTEYLQERLEAVDNHLINHDFKPVAYFFDMLLWSAQTNPGFLNFFDWFAQHAYTMLFSGLIFLILMIFLLWKPDRVPTTLATSVMLAGFTQIGLEVILIIGFQALYGYAYYLVAFIVSGFMVGMAGGSWLAVRVRIEKKNAWRNLLMVQLGFAIVPGVLAAVFLGVSWVRMEIFSSVLTEILFLGLAILTGFAGGYLFPIASEIAVQSGKSPERAGGTLYGFDLLGACFGALLTSAFLIPLFGIYQTLWLFSFINAIGAGLVILASRTGAKI